MLSIILKPVALDKSFTRTQEYIPLIAQVYTTPKKVLLSMIYLFSGKYMGSRVDLENTFTVLIYMMIPSGLN